MPFLPFWRRPAWLLGLAGLLAASAFRWPTEDALFQRVVKSLVGFYGTSLPEKAYLHLDRSLYASGETVWFRAYVVEADSHRPDTLSKVLYVELLRGARLVAQRTLRLRGGLATGDLTLPDTLAAGTYQLRAYTSWMRNAGPAFFFARPLAVTTAAGTLPAPAAAARPEVQFFPEGGYLVAGLPSTVGVKAVDAQGRGTAVQGRVLDAQGQVVAHFSSRHAGMGSFELLPQAGQQYRAEVSLPGGGQAQYPLPACQPAGYSLQVRDTPTEFVVTLRQQGPAPTGPALLLAQVRGHVAFAAQARVSATTPVVARLPKAKFASGLAHLTLFDAQGEAQCERLVLVPNPPGVRLTLTADRAAYAPRQLVRLSLAATDAAGQPVAGNFSVAVGTPAPGGPDDNPTIVSHLLLSSDLAGVVEDPGYYFREPQTPEIQQALNDLLLTQGWRRFVWKTLLAGQLPGRDYPLEQGLGVSGQALTAAGQPAVGRLVLYQQTSPTREAQQPTDASGRFRFRGLDGLDTTYVLLRTAATRGAALPTLTLLPPPPAAVVPSSRLAAPAPALAEYARLGAAQHRWQLTATSQPVVLGTVRVRGQRPIDAPLRSYNPDRATVLHVPDAARTGDSRTVLQYLQGRVAGVAVSGNTINIRQSASLQSQNNGGFALIEPLYVIDGMVVGHDTFVDYPISEIETIDVLNQGAATLFGIQAYGGVIVIYSRRQHDALPVAPVAGQPGVLSVRIPGYYQAREFYAPRYPAASAAPDARYATLYWLPSVQTDASGHAQLSFFTSDARGLFQVTAEGLSAQGTPMRGTAQLRVE